MIFNFILFTSLLFIKFTLSEILAYKNASSRNYFYESRLTNFSLPLQPSQGIPGYLVLSEPIHTCKIPKKPRIIRATHPEYYLNTEVRNTNKWSQSIRNAFCEN